MNDCEGSEHSIDTRSHAVVNVYSLKSHCMTSNKNGCENMTRAGPVEGSERATSSHWSRMMTSRACQCQPTQASDRQTHACQCQPTQASDRQTHACQCQPTQASDRQTHACQCQPTQASDGGRMQSPVHPCLAGWTCRQSRRICLQREHPGVEACRPTIARRH
jgi:hypothetical protein